MQYFFYENGVSELGAGLPLTAILKVDAASVIVPVVLKFRKL